MESELTELWDTYLVVGDFEKWSWKKHHVFGVSSTNISQQDLKKNLNKTYQLKGKICILELFWDYPSTSRNKTGDMMEDDLTHIFKVFGINTNYAYSSYFS